MNTLVTGGAGFIGSNICKRLVADGHQVVAIDNLSNGSVESIKELEGNNNFIFYEFDVNNTIKLRRIFDKHPFDMVFHLAANADTAKGEEAPHEDIENTLFTTLNILEMMRVYDIKKFFFASSSMCTEMQTSAFRSTVLLCVQYLIMEQVNLPVKHL